MREIQKGDRVAYSVQFLRSTGQVAGEAGHARGIVLELIPLTFETTLARVQWDRDMPERVNRAEPRTSRAEYQVLRMLRVLRVLLVCA
jgi:hypothetical protein